ncbi:MAG: tRNA-dihydrouridine synthase family protein [bacterium]
MDWLKLQQPIIALGAMDGVTDTSFRQICHEWGADVVFTEFIHSTGLLRSAKYRDPILKFSEKERPVIVQIYGNNPDDFYSATKYVLSLGFDGVDINMGCPSKSVSGHGSGCALMRTPDLAENIVKSVIKARNEYTASISDSLKLYEKKHYPVTVKMRIGYDNVIAKDFAQMLQQAGAEGLIVHGRTLKMGYSGYADWNVIGDVAKNISIPVLGNGDVKKADDVKRALDLGCIGVTIGRATFGNPFIFHEIKRDLNLPTNKDKNIEINLKLRLNTYLEHAKLAFNESGDRGLIESRKHISGYVKGFENASEVRQKLIFAKTVDEIEEIIKSSLY